MYFFQNIACFALLVLLCRNTCLTEYVTDGHSILQTGQSVVHRFFSDRVSLLCMTSKRYGLPITLFSFPGESGTFSHRYQCLSHNFFLFIMFEAATKNEYAYDIYYRTFKTWRKHQRRRSPWITPYHAYNRVNYAFINPVRCHLGLMALWSLHIFCAIRRCKEFTPFWAI